MRKALPSSIPAKEWPGRSSVFWAMRTATLRTAVIPAEPPPRGPDALYVTGAAPIEERYGYFAAQFGLSLPAPLREMLQTVSGEVLYGINTIYFVRAEGSLLQCRIKGKVLDEAGAGRPRRERRSYNPIAPGDIVEVVRDSLSSREGRIARVLDRKTSLTRWNKKGRAPPGNCRERGPCRLYFKPRLASVSAPVHRQAHRGRRGGRA